MSALSFYFVYGNKICVKSMLTGWMTIFVLTTEKQIKYVSCYRYIDNCLGQIFTFWSYVIFFPWYFSCTSRNYFQKLHAET